MKDQEWFQGFDKTKQMDYEKAINEKFWQKGKDHLEESKKRVNQWKSADSPAD